MFCSWQYQVMVQISHTARGILPYGASGVVSLSGVSSPCLAFLYLAWVTLTKLLLATEAYAALKSGLTRSSKAVTDSSAKLIAEEPPGFTYWPRITSG